VSKEPGRTTRFPQRPAHKDAGRKPLGDFSVKYLVEILFRRKRLFLVPVLLVPVLAVAASFLIAPEYMSTTTILLEQKEILNPLVRYQTAVSLTDFDRLKLFQKIIYSRPLIEEAIRLLGMDRELRGEKEMESMVHAFRRNIHIMNLSGDSFQIGCSWSAPQTAKDMVETISDLFIDKSLEGSRREASAAVTFIGTQVEHYQDELGAAEKKLRDYKLENIDLLTQKNIISGELNDFQAKMLTAELELKQQQLTLELLEQRLSGEKPMVVAQALFVQNTPYQRQYQELQMRMGNLLSTRKPNHPEVRELQREMDYIVDLLEREKEEKQASETQEVRSPVYQEISARLEDTRIEVQVLTGEIEEYRQVIGELQAKLLLMPDLEKTYSNLESEVKNIREIYDTLRIKLEHARVSQEVELEQQTNRFTIIEPPLVPLSRHKPILKMFVAGGAAGGVLLGLVLVFALEFLDPTVIRKGEAERLLEAELLGTLPKIHLQGEAGSRLQRVMETSRLGWVRGLMGARQYVMPGTFPTSKLLTPELLEQQDTYVHQGFAPLRELVERFRLAGINALSRYEGQDGLLWGVISAKSQEGKTFLSANLAVVLAQDLKRPVLLLDGNLRSPRLTELFSGRDAPGFSEVLRGAIAPEEAVRETSVPRVHILPAGGAVPDPAALFQEERLPAALAALRERFSLILMELPALTSNAEGMIVSPHTDGLLVLAKLYVTRKKVLEAALEKVDRRKIVGLVLNNAEYWIPHWLYGLI